jgi:putative transposase
LITCDESFRYPSDGYAGFWASIDRRSARRHAGADDEQALTEDIIALAKQYGRYGYRRVTALLCQAGWTVNHQRVERIWRREGLKVPLRQPKRGRLWLNDGSCIRLRPEYPGHVWAYDFVEGRTHDGRKFRILTIADEASRECLALIVASQLKHEDVLAAWPICSSRAVLRHIYGLITEANLSRPPSRNGCVRSA